MNAAPDPRPALALLLIAALCACGGGGAEGPVAPLAAQVPPASATPPWPCAGPPEAEAPIAVVAGGTISGRPDSSFILVAPYVRDFGFEGYTERLLFYGPDLSKDSRVTGYVWSGLYASCSSTDPTPRNGTDYPSQARAYLQITSRGAGPDVAGSIRSGGVTATFSGGRIPGSTYVFDAAPRLADAAGAWSLNPLKGDAFRVEIAADGSLTGEIPDIQLLPGGSTGQSCKLTGRVAVDPQERMNLLRLTVSTPCWPYPNAPYEGFALVMPLETGGTQLLLWAATGNGVDGTVLLGIGRR